MGASPRPKPLRRGQLRERFERERAALHDLALGDPLTGIANRRSLLLRAEYEIARHTRVCRTFALVMIDLDGFKRLNDRFGHAAGDDLLREVSVALTDSMRAQNTVARLGGDEFCVLAPETGDSGTVRLATRIAQAIGSVTAGSTWSGRASASPSSPRMEPPLRRCWRSPISGCSMRSVSGGAVRYSGALLDVQLTSD